MVEVSDKVQQRRDKGMAGKVQAQRRQEIYGKSADEHRRGLQCWQAVMKHITSLENHGSKKPEGTPWVEFCRDAIVGYEETVDFPPQFQLAETSFEDVVELASSQAAEYRANCEKLGSALSALVKKQQKRETFHSKREETMKRRLADLVDADSAAQIKAKALSLDLFWLLC